MDPAKELQLKLFEIPEIVSSFSNKENKICERWINWLEDLEKILKKYKYSQCAAIAGYRSTIISKSMMVTIKRAERKKMTFNQAMSSIQPVQQILSDKSNELTEKIEQARILIRQIIIPAKDAGMINYDKNTDFTVFIESLITQFKTHDQVAPLINNTLASIGKYDVMRILAEEIEFQ